MRKMDREGSCTQMVLGLSFSLYQDYIKIEPKQEEKSRQKSLLSRTSYKLLYRAMGIKLACASYLFIYIYFFGGTWV
jgi:hypothetical protein